MGKHWALYIFLHPLVDSYFAIDFRPTAQAGAASTKTFWLHVDQLEGEEKKVKCLNFLHLKITYGRLSSICPEKINVHMYASG